MAVAAALPHVAAEPAPGPAPAPVAKGSAAGAELELQKPAPTPPPAPGAIHKAWCPQQRASGSGRIRDLFPELCGVRACFVFAPGWAGCRVTSPASVREATASGSGRQYPRLVAGPCSAARGKIRLWGVRSPRADGESCIPVTWPVSGGPWCYLASHPSLAGWTRFLSRTRRSYDVTRRPWWGPRAPLRSRLR